MKGLDHGIGAVPRGLGRHQIDDQAGEHPSQGGDDNQQVVVRGGKGQHLGGGSPPEGLNVAGEEGNGMLQNKTQQLIKNDGSYAGDYAHADAQHYPAEMVGPTAASK